MTFFLCNEDVDYFLLQSKILSLKMRAWLKLSEKLICALWNTACLKHIECLWAKYGHLYHERNMKLFLNIDAVHPLMFFSLKFLLFVLLSQSAK